MRLGNCQLDTPFVAARKQGELKYAHGIRRKNSTWNDWLYPIVLADFEGLGKSGLKFNPKVP